MAQRARFFDSDDGDRTYGSAAFAEVIRALIGDGVVAGLGDELEVTESNPPAMTVDVADGGAFVRGYFLEVYSGPDSVAISAADSTNPRIDLVVVRRDLTGRTASIAVLTGTPAASPSAPTPTQSEAGTWEIPLASVLVAASASSITNAAITDLRGARAQGTDLSALTDPNTGHRHDGTEGGGRKVRYTDLTSVPTTFAPSPHGHTGSGDGGTVAYGAITGKPSTFAPATHDHTSVGEGGTIPFWRAVSAGGRITASPNQPSNPSEGDVWIEG